MILLVDRSEQGWGMVEEYVADDLAKDSNDERRIEKAENMAERKASWQSERHPKGGRNAKWTP